MVEFPEHFGSLQHPLSVDPSHIPNGCTNQWEDLEENTLVFGQPNVTVMIS